MHSSGAPAGESNHDYIQLLSALCACAVQLLGQGCTALALLQENPIIVIRTQSFLYSIILSHHYQHHSHHSFSILIRATALRSSLGQVSAMLPCSRMALAWTGGLFVEMPVCTQQVSQIAELLLAATTCVKFNLQSHYVSFSRLKNHHTFTSQCSLTRCSCDSASTGSADPQ